MTQVTQSAKELADNAIRQVLLTQYREEPLVRIDSPPGAGKTGLVERLAVQSMQVFKERCMIVTQTNQQCFDLLQRLAVGFPKLQFHLLASNKLPIQSRLLALKNIIVIHKASEIPDGPCIVVANSKKWAYYGEGHNHFDLQIIDEAYQLHDAGFHLISNLAHRVVLVGDPGQIDPVVTCEVERWASDPAGPHIACPKALSARHPNAVTKISLPITRRLRQDTVDFIQPAFYPKLQFCAISKPASRSFKRVRSQTKRQILNRAIKKISDGASLIQVELPKVTESSNISDADLDLIELMIELVNELTTGHFNVSMQGKSQSNKPISPEMIGITCAHVTQVSAIRERLPRHCSDVLVETANRFQGLERPIMLVYHPLSGRDDLTDFHLDAGRFCVMVSRHSLACIVFSRQGIEEALSSQAPISDRFLGIESDTRFDSWHAHLLLYQQLKKSQRIVQ